MEKWIKYIQDTERDLQIIYLNIRSLRKNYSELLVLLKGVENTLDIIILSEINIKHQELTLYKIEGYEMFAYTREIRRGGGILIYVKTRLCPETINSQANAMEILHCRFKKLSQTCQNQNNLSGMIHVIAIYRPPNSNKVMFIKELDELLKQIPDRHDIVIIGDANINILNTTDIVEKYKNTLCEHGLQCAISECTREEMVGGVLSGSCIDHVWVRSRECAAAHMLTCKISDHYMVGVNLANGGSGSVYTVSKENNAVCVFNNKAIRSELAKIDWNELLIIRCPILLYDKMCVIFSNIYNSCKTTIQKNTRETQPWINITLKTMISRRDELFRKWKACPKNVCLRLEYTRHRNRTNKLINTAREKFRKKQILDCKGDYRKIWSTINGWLGNKKENIDNVIMKYLGRTDSVRNICTNFARTFTEEIAKIKHHCNYKFLDRATYVSQCNVSFRFPEVSAKEIEKQIDKLNVGKAPGTDGIRVQDLKFVKMQISPVLAKFVNMCVGGGVYPTPLKKSIIRPIYKQGSHLEYSNYRPIAILSVVNKITEKVIINKIHSFLDTHNIISPTQHGFRKARSTSTALVQFADDINEKLDNRMYVVVLFLDFKKAFDTLDHEVLLNAMKECGIRGPVNQWFGSYLKNRTLHTMIQGETGEEANIMYGVPTGSVYGPVGYIMHVNSISNVVEHSSTYMYADDTCLVCADRDITLIQQKLQYDFNNILKWAHDNGIILNVTKTKCMLVNSPKMKLPAESVKIIGHTYECLHNDLVLCNCNPLEVVRSYRYLGLTIDNHFNWKPHVDGVCNKLRAILCKLKNLNRVLNKSTLLILYHALAESVLSYGLIAYGRTFKTYLDRIYKLQQRMLKAIVDKKTKQNCKGRYHILFKKCKVLPVHVKFKYVMAIEQYRCHVYKIVKTQNRNLRLSLRKMYIEPRSNNYYGQRTRRYLIPRIYNNIGFLEKDCKSIRIFKSKVKDILMGTFLVENTH
jgi:hypothetical protein